MIDIGKARWFVVVLAAMGFASAGGAAIGQMIERQSLAETAQAASKEGRFTWYDSIAPDEVTLIVAAFEKRYPTVKVDYIEVGGSARVARITQESKAGGPTTDITTLSAANIMGLAAQGLLRTVDWKALGSDASLAPNEYMLATAATVFVTIYNSDKVSEADAPRTHEALVDPKWKGRWGTWAQAAGLRTILPTWGEERTTAYVEKLAANGSRLYRNPQALAEAVGAGESDVGIFVPYHTVLPTIKKGAPVKVWFPEPLPISTVYGFLPKAGRSPNAGKLFLSWLASSEGAAALETITGRGSPFVGGTEMSRMVQGKAFAVEEAQAAIDRNEWLETMATTYGRMLQGR